MGRSKEAATQVAENRRKAAQMVDDAKRGRREELVSRVNRNRERFLDRGPRDPNALDAGDLVGLLAGMGFATRMAKVSPRGIRQVDFYLADEAGDGPPDATARITNASCGWRIEWDEDMGDVAPVVAMSKLAGFRWIDAANLIGSLPGTPSVVRRGIRRDMTFRLRPSINANAVWEALPR